MSPRRIFDRVMISVEIGRDLKLRPLTDAEWRVFVGGILPIAAKSPIRGRLLIGDRGATEDDFAAQAGAKVTAARSALKKLRGIGIVLDDSEFGCERVHDFEDWNPPPKTDKTAAERQQRRRDRLREEGSRHAVTPVTSRSVTGDRHADEVEVEGERKQKEVVLSVVGGRERETAQRTNTNHDLAEHVRGILQRGIDSLQADQRCKTPTTAGVAETIGREGLDREQAVAAAFAARSIAQAQDRAPNIEALFAKKAAEQVRKGAA